MAVDEDWDNKCPRAKEGNDTTTMTTNNNTPN
jgi:phage FluMu protein Com